MTLQEWVAVCFILGTLHSMGIYAWLFTRWTRIAANRTVATPERAGAQLATSFALICGSVSLYAAFWAVLVLIGLLEPAPPGPDEAAGILYFVTATTALAVTGIQVWAGVRHDAILRRSLEL